MQCSCAKDLDTNKESYYQYDKDNNTFIKYSSSLLKKMEKYKLLTIASVSFATLMLIINIIIVLFKSKKRK